MKSHHIQIIKNFLSITELEWIRAGPLATCLVLISPQPSHIKMIQEKGLPGREPGTHLQCLSSHNICLLQGAWDAICPHMPSGFPVKHQGKSPKEDGSSKGRGFSATLSPVAKYLLGQAKMNPNIS